jgi:hypothetical protein
VWSNQESSEPYWRDAFVENQEKQALLEAFHTDPEWPEYQRMQTKFHAILDASQKRLQERKRREEIPDDEDDRPDPDAVEDLLWEANPINAKLISKKSEINESE